ncbi:F-box protein CPR1-like [Nicotiana sylvestris]|uniref:F-box protein CPR1-like n=1 Tax=Nicotiana sylvestris TaxID=4096 RepID=UPI00388C8930
MSDFVIPVLPREIIVEILLKVPSKFLLKFRCVSKSWLQLISSPEFVNAHLKLTVNDKECSPHRGIFQDSEGNFKLQEPVLWNPTIRKSKKLPAFGANSRKGCSYYCKYGFGYDELHDDYKVVVIQCKFANRKLYWALSANVDTFNMCNIISLDLADETWRRLDLPSYEDSSYPLTLGVVGSDLSVLCPCRQVTNSDVWILKDCGVKVSWTKIFTIEHHRDLGEFIFFSSIFSIPFCQSNKGESLLLLPPVIMIYDGSTRQLEAIENKEYFAAEIYVESLIDPLLIAGRGRCNLEISQSFGC